jgi:hypothetical protein
MRKTLLIAGFTTLLFSGVLVFAQQGQLPANQPTAPFGAQTPNNQDPFNQQSQSPSLLLSSSPPPSGALLLEDGSSILLLEDGSSHLCLEGGC